MRHEILLLALEDRYGVARFPSVVRKSNCRVTVIGNPMAVVSWSRFVDRIIPCPRDKEHVINLLRQIIIHWRGPRPWVVFSDEISLEAAAAHRDEPWLKDILPVDPQGPMLDVILRKTSFMQFAKDNGLPIPSMRICNSVAEAQAAGEEFTFPLFMKRDVDCAGAGVIQIHAPEDIASAFPLLSYSKPVLVQQMIHGRLCKANMLYQHGKVMSWSAAYALKTWPGKFGPSCVREYVCDPKIDALVHRVGELTGFNGLCGFDTIHDEKTGEFVMIEFNGRLTPHYHLGVHVGVDYGRAISDFLQGRMSVQKPEILHGMPPTIRVFPQDFRRCLSDRDWKGLLRWLPGTSTKDIPWTDANLILFFFVDFIRKTAIKLANRIPWRHVVLTVKQSKVICEGMAYADVLKRLGPPIKEIGAEIPIMIYRMVDGREVLIGLGGSGAGRKVVSVKYRKAGEIAA